MADLLDQELHVVCGEQLSPLDEADHAGEHGLEITTNGTWVNTSMYEVPVLAIVNEVYFRMNYDYNMLSDSFEERLEEKYNKVRNNDWYLGVFSEFGFHLIFSIKVHHIIIN